MPTGPTRTPLGCGAAVSVVGRVGSVCSESAKNPRCLTPANGLWRDQSRPAGAPPNRPTSFGTAGRLQSEQVADINRDVRIGLFEPGQCSRRAPDLMRSAPATRAQGAELCADGEADCGRDQRFREVPAAADVSAIVDNLSTEGSL